MSKNLHLIPVSINPSLEVKMVWAEYCIHNLNHFIVENERTARRYLKQVNPDVNQQELKFEVLDKRAANQDLNRLFSLFSDADEVGLLSEAGVPCVADPGNQIVMEAHQRGITVVPHVGPSSILLALMASGLNGQNFAFNGYLPIDETERRVSIRAREQSSLQHDQTQMFIETPYRNDKLFVSLTRNLRDSTLLSVACDLTTPTEFICTRSVYDWKQKTPPSLHKRPCIFSYLAAG